VLECFALSGRNSMVECQLPKLKVAGSIPVARSNFTDIRSLPMTNKRMRIRLISVFVVLALPLSNFCYGPRGHTIVGAIADLRLSTSKQASAKVAKLLDGLSLAEAATLADSIKGWDDCNGNPGQYTVAGGFRINSELRAFVRANSCDGKSSHHQFHYTDVPIAGDEKYDAGKIGRSDLDVVHMIAYCIRVLADREPQPNPRAITKTVAVILLAHYLGDIHQPLHVGAEYFDDDGNAVEPAAGKRWHGDQGGNKLNLFLYESGKVRALGGFHGYWDSKVVDAAFGDTLDSKIELELAKAEPAGWKLTGNPDSLARQMADEILPIAREAHRRLDYSKVRVDSDGTITAGRALERQMPESYAAWSQGVVRLEIQKAGWRLAAILHAVLGS
jgi:hypothetical protein